MKQSIWIAALLSAAILVSGSISLHTYAEESDPNPTETEAADAAVPQTDFEDVNAVPIMAAAEVIDPSLLVYQPFNDGIAITGCDASVTGNIVLPDTIDGLPVIRITKEAFPREVWEEADGVYYVDTWAIDVDAAAKNVTFRDGTVGICQDAFDACEALESVTTPDSLIYAATALPDSVKVLNLGAGLPDGQLTNWIPYYSPWYYFSKADPAPLLAEINISHDNPYYTSVDGIVYNKDMTKLIRVPYQKAMDTYTVPDTVTDIAYDALQFCEGIGALTIPANVQASDSYINCTGCTGMKSVFIEDGALINEISFENCRSLESIHLPKDLSQIGWGDFRLCTSLKEITIPASITSIASMAFDNCSSLTSITFEGTIETIGFRAFSYCDHLTDITLPEGLTQISGGAFLDCEQLKTLKLPSTLQSIGDWDGWTFFHCYALETIEIPDGVTMIGPHTFRSCTSLQSVKLPETLESIRYNAFENTPELTKLTLPASLTTLDDSALSGSGLESITIPATVTEMGFGVLSRTPALKSAVIETPLTELPNGTFRYAVALENVTLPDSITKIQSYAFQGCSSLKTFAFPPALQRINSHAFEDCVKLESADLPSSVLRIGNSAFRNCTVLSSLTLPEGLIIIGSDVFYNDPALPSVTFPTTLQSMGTLCFGFNEPLPPEPEPTEEATEDDDDGWGMTGDFGWYGYHKTEDFTVYGLDNSIAEWYATIHQMKFVAIDPPEDAKPVQKPQKLFIPKSSTTQLSVPGEGEIIWLNNSTWSIELDDNGNVTTGDYPTTAYVYAVCDGGVYPFELNIGYLLGDPTADNSIDIMDVIMVNKYILGRTYMSSEEKNASDVDGNGKIDTNDSLTLLKYVVEIISSFDEV